MATMSAPETQAVRIQSAVDGPVSMGPRFLSGEVDADTMANAMIAAVHTYVAAEKVDGRDGTPLGDEAAELYPVLQEFMACGGGYLAGRCDAACVARTMTELVAEYGG